MPKYVGKGKTFYLITCERMPSPNCTKDEKVRFHQTYCSKCGFYMDAVERQENAVKKGKEWRKLICVRPENKQMLQKWTPHITVWG